MQVLSQDLGSRMSIAAPFPVAPGPKLVILDTALLYPEDDVGESIDQHFHRSRSILGHGVSNYIVARSGFSC